MRRTPAPAADVRAGRGQPQGAVRCEQGRIRAVQVRVAADDEAALGPLRRELQPAGSGQPQQVRARPAVADVQQVAGGRVPGVVADVDALAGRPGSFERDRQRRRVRIRADRLAVGDLDRALAVSRPRTPSAVSSALVETMSTASAVGSPAPSAGSWKIETVWAVPAFWIRTACCGFAGLAWFTTSRRPRASAPRLE